MHCFSLNSQIMFQARFTLLCPVVLLGKDPDPIINLDEVSSWPKRAFSNWDICSEDENLIGTPLPSEVAERCLRSGQDVVAAYEADAACRFAA